MQDMEDLSSPTSAFVRDCCEVGLNQSVVIDDLYRKWVWWSEQQGRREPGTKQTFARDLRAHLPSVVLRRPRDGDSRMRTYEGIGLKDPSQSAG
jgi:putative DNA primase/helicase